MKGLRCSFRCRSLRPDEGGGGFGNRGSGEFVLMQGLGLKTICWELTYGVSWDWNIYVS